MTSVESKLKAAIAKLGRSRKSVEAELIKRRIVGIPGCPTRCVLAKYFSRVLRREVTVDGEVAICDEDTVTLPRALESFVNDFDARRCDPRLYPRPRDWTPPIQGYQYAMRRISDNLYRSDASCPVCLTWCGDLCMWFAMSKPRDRCTDYCETPEEALRALGVKP